MPRLARLMLLGLLLVSTDAGARAEKIALDGDVAPGTGGGVYDFDADVVVSFPSPARMDESGRVVFSTRVGGGSVSRAIFRATGTSVEALVATGDPAPDTGGGTFSDFELSPGNTGAFFPVSGEGKVAFYAAVSGGTTTSGVFLTDGVTTTAVALEGGAAPGGGTWSLVVPLGVDDAGHVVIAGELDGVFGFYLHTGSAVATIALEGATATGTGGATYQLGIVPFVDLNDQGQVAFVAKLTGGTTDSGLFLYDGGAVTTLAVEGDPAPGTGGLPFDCNDGPYCSVPCSALSAIPAFSHPELNDAGVIAFHANYETGPACGDLAGGIFRYAGGTLTAALLAGDPAPGGLGTFRDFRSPLTRIDLNRRDEVVFAAVTEGATLENGLFVLRASGVEVVQLSEGVAPGTGGAEWSGFGLSPSLDATGTRFAEISSIYDGQSSSLGLFLFRTPVVPVLPAAALGALLLALSVAAGARLRGRP